MGSCFSASAATVSTAKVINADGSLIDYSTPVQVSHVLGLNRPAFFLCDADELVYGHHIQALDDDYSIQLGKLYFFLPAKRLKHALTATEMAALAVSASSAFAGADLMRRRRKGGQVMPMIGARDDGGYYERFNENSVGSWKIERDEVKLTALKRRGSGVKRPYRPKLSSIEEVYD